MKRSASIALSLVATAAMVACRDQGPVDAKVCTDMNGKVVDDRLCEGQPQTANGTNPHDNFIMNMLIYRWVFGGNFFGGHVGGGSFYPMNGVSYYRSSSEVGRSIISSGNAHTYTSVSRGGFGSSFRGGGGGEGGAGE